MIIQISFKKIAIALSLLAVLMVSNEGIARVNNIQIYDYQNTQNPENFKIIPHKIRSYYSADSADNPLQLNLNQLVKVATWQDAQGENYLLQFENSTDDSYEKEEGDPDIDKEMNELVSHMYVTNSNGTRRLWQVYDFQNDCGLDITAKYTPASPAISDVNENGIAEVAVSYYLDCRGDIGYHDMKVIMYEGQQKFAARGHSALCSNLTNLPVSEDRDYGGEHSIDESLLNNSDLAQADKALMRQQLQSVWLQNQCSTIFYYDNAS